MVKSLFAFLLADSTQETFGNSCRAISIYFIAGTDDGDLCGRTTTMNSSATSKFVPITTKMEMCNWIPTPTKKLLAPNQETLRPSPLPLWRQFPRPKLLSTLIWTKITKQWIPPHLRLCEELCPLQKPRLTGTRSRITKSEVPLEVKPKPKNWLGSLPNHHVVCKWQEHLNIQRVFSFLLPSLGMNNFQSPVSRLVPVRILSFDASKLRKKPAHENNVSKKMTKCWRVCVRHYSGWPIACGRGLLCWVQLGQVELRDDRPDIQFCSQEFRPKKEILEWPRKRA